MDKPINMLKCKSCGGEYENILDDGMEYYHACPPLFDFEGEMAELADRRDENIGKFKEGKGAELVTINIQ